MEKLEMLYRGKAKLVYETDEPEYCILEYEDNATAFNGQKKGRFEGKGVINNKMANMIFKLLQEDGIKTHFIKELGDRETLVKRVSIIPLEVIIRNVAAGSFTKKYGTQEGTPLKAPSIEFSYKKDELGDPQISDYQAIALGLSTREVIDYITDTAFKINESLKKIFLNIGIKLIDFKIEFGIDNEGEVLLADEISPDTCRLWDAETDKKLDKDRFRLDLGEFGEVYSEVYNRLKDYYR